MSLRNVAYYGEVAASHHCIQGDVTAVAVTRERNAYIVWHGVIDSTAPHGVRWAPAAEGAVYWHSNTTERTPRDRALERGIHDAQAFRRAHGKPRK